MRFQTASSPHLPSPNSVGRVMSTVMLAMLPGLGALTWQFGWGVPLQLLLAATVALAAEAAVLTLRGRPLAPSLTDGSALLTALLLAAALPPLVPWWITALGVGFAIVVAKHLYGGLGYNPFNPAMVGYVVLLISFPLEMSRWQAPAALSGAGADFGTAFDIIFLGAPLADALTAATPLDVVRTGLGRGLELGELIGGPAFGHWGGAGWEWIALAWLAGGLWLLRQRAADWRIPLSLLATLAALTAAGSLLAPATTPPLALQLLAGATIYGAFFIATDPVTAATTARGRWLYGAGIGVLVYVIRGFGGYPEGFAFAVLLMNIVAPTLDLYTKPRVYGAGRG